MAKIFISIFCVLLFCSCRDSSVPKAGVEPLPTFSDTSFADTTKVSDIVVDTVILKDTVSVKMVKDTIKVKDTVVAIVVPKRTLSQIYLSFVGVRELTGNNDGVEVEMFLKTVGLGKGYAWCAAFVKYCLLEAGIKKAEKINGMALSAVNKTNMVFEKSKKLKQPKQGDVATLYYTKLGRIGHTLFWHKEINSSIYESVEGNTNDGGGRDGDGVYKRKRSYNATYNISRWTE